MSYERGETRADRYWLWWRTSVRTIAILLTSGVAGATLVALAWNFDEKGPPILLGIALVPVVLVLTMNDARVATLAVFASFLFGFASITIFGFNFQAVDIAILVATVLVIVQRLAIRDVPLVWAAPLWWAFLLVTWSVLSMTSAEDQSQAAKQVGSLLAGLIFATIVLTLTRRVRDARFISSGLVAVAALIVLPALGQMGQLQSYYGGSLVEGRLTGLFIEPNELGLFSAMTALITAGLFLAARTTFARLGYLAVIGVLLLGLMLSLSRGAWLGTAVGVTVLLITLPAARRIVLLTAAPLLVVGFLVSSIMPSNPSVRVVGERLRAIVDIDQPYDQRPDIYAEAVRQIRDDPYTGQGPGNFSVAAQRLTTGGVIVTASHAHNSYLNIAAELGLPALLFLVAFILTLAGRGRHAIRACHEAGRSSDAAVVAGISAALAANAATGIVNNFLGNAIIEPTIWASIGMLLGSYRATMSGAAMSEEETQFQSLSRRIPSAEKYLPRRERILTFTRTDESPRVS